MGVSVVSQVCVYTIGFFCKSINTLLIESLAFGKYEVAVL